MVFILGRIRAPGRHPDSYRESVVFPTQGNFGGTVFFRRHATPSSVFGTWDLFIMTTFLTFWLGFNLAFLLWRTAVAVVRSRK